MSTSTMNKFEKRFKLGTMVLLQGLKEWCRITEIHETRNWIKVDGWMGSFQRAHVIRFTNSGVQKIKIDNKKED